VRPVQIEEEEQEDEEEKKEHMIGGLEDIREKSRERG
jgi:hypothetical protein